MGYKSVFYLLGDSELGQFLKKTKLLTDRGTEELPQIHTNLSCLVTSMFQLQHLSPSLQSCSVQHMCTRGSTVLGAPLAVARKKSFPELQEKLRRGFSRLREYNFILGSSDSKVLEPI